MATVSVDKYTIDTSADVSTVNILLGEAWQSNWLRARLSKIEDLGNNRFRLREGSANIIDVSVKASDSGSIITTHVHATSTRQTTLFMIIPLGPKTIVVNNVMKSVLMKKLLPSLTNAGYTAIHTVDSVTIGR